MHTPEGAPFSRTELFNQLLDDDWTAINVELSDELKMLVTEMLGNQAVTNATIYEHEWTQAVDIL